MLVKCFEWSNQLSVIDIFYMFNFEFVGIETNRSLWAADLKDFWHEMKAKLKYGAEVLGALASKRGFYEKL